MRLDRDGALNLSGFLSGRPELGPLALRNGLISEVQLHECLEEQRQSEPPRSLESILVARGLLTPEQLTDLLQQRKLLEQQTAGEQASLPEGVRRTVGRYALVEQLGAGGAGAVWKAWDTQLHRWVALKEPRYEQGVSRERFQREARAAARLRHPHLVEVFEIDQDNGLDYMVMEYVEGRSLDQVRLDVVKIADLMADVCDAVHAMHANGVLHRDIKPQNIIVDAHGMAHLGDFGIAKVLGNEPMTLAGSLLGTPQYMAPEQAARNADAIGPRTDVYGLGATLYHALTGRPAYDAETGLQTLFEKLMNEAPPPLRSFNPAVPVELDWIVRRAMAKDPEERYPTAAELRDDLRRFVRGEEVLAHPLPWTWRALKRIRRHPKVAAAAALVGVATVLTAFFTANLVRRQENYETARQKGDERWRKAVDFTRGRPIPRDKMTRAAREAIAQYDEAAAAMPHQPYPWLMRGRCLVLLGERNEAEASWTKALKLDPAHAQALFERGKYYMSAYVTMRLPQRAQIGGGRVRFGPPDPENDAQKEWRRKGEEDLSRARQAGALEKVALSFLEGALDLGEGRFGAAVEKLLKYADEYPGDVDALTFLGAAQYYTGRLDEAERTWLRALDLEPEARRYKSLGDVRYCLGKYPEAAGDYTQALKLDPENPVMLCNRALALQAHGDHASALADYSRALQINPRLARAYNGRGTVYYDLKQYDRALEDFERALEADELYPEAHNNLGNVRMMRQEIEEAVREYDFALAIDPGYAEAYINRGVARTMKGDVEAAIADFEQALKCDDTNPEACYRLALALRGRGDQARAIDTLRHAVRLSPPEGSPRRRCEDLLRTWTRE